MLIILDKDGTLVGNKNGPPNWGDPQTLLPGVADACDYYREQGNVLAVASNQGGVALGYLTYGQALLMVSQVAEQISAAAFEFCPYHPEGTVLPYKRDAVCRKPKPGMLTSLMLSLNFDAEDTLMVGDSPEDRGAAAAAGVAFRLADEFFGDWG